MIEICGDIRDYFGKAIVAITTNGQVTRTGTAIFGRGCASLAQDRYPDLSRCLGEQLMAGGNHVYYLDHGIVSFPVEDTPWSLPDLKLIRRSAVELKELADRQGWERVIVPRPGCGGGGLQWSQVSPILAGHLDDRFHILTAPPAD